MSDLNERVVLEYYLEKIEKDEIAFLKNRNKYKDNIKEFILRLRDEKIIHNKIEISKELWKALFESAMSFIDPDKRGYDHIFTYFDKYVDFEELIFASDSFYRDHTMHCLWVYFLGEFIKGNEKFGFIFNKMDEKNEQFNKLYKTLKDANTFETFNDTLSIFEKIVKAEEYSDSIRCITAITHDLGYPIKKINKINKSIGEILPYFNIYDYDEFNFNYTEIQKKYIDEFIEILSFNIIADFKYDFDRLEENGLIDKFGKINKNMFLNSISEEIMKQLNEEEREVIRKSFEGKLRFQRIIDNNLRYLSDFEQYNHGIMSAYLLSKNIESFNKLKVAYSNLDNIDLKNFDFINFTSKTSILKAITDHTSKGYQISAIDNVSAFLVLIDELEEFSRISRANQNRQYINEFCKTRIYTEEGYFIIDFIFNNTNIDNLDPERAFKGRCKRFLSLFKIYELNEAFKIKLRCIGELPYDKNTYELEIKRKYAKITINKEEKNIPQYLKSNEFYTREEYMSI